MITFCPACKTNLIGDLAPRPHCEARPGGPCGWVYCRQCGATVSPKTGHHIPKARVA